MRGHQYFNIYRFHRRPAAGMFFAGFAFLALLFSIILNIRKLLLNSQRLEGLDKGNQINSFRAMLVAVAEGNIKTVRKYTKKSGSASDAKGLNLLYKR